MYILYNNKSVNFGNRWLEYTGITPPDPITDVGYWKHKDSGAVTEFDTTDSSIIGTTFNTPSWKTNASEIRLPAGVTTIASSALANSPDLVTLVLPSSITSIGSNILSNTPKFENLYSYALTAPSLTSLGSNVGDYRLQIKVEADSFDSYRLASGWSQYYLKLFVLNDLIPGSRVHNGYTVQTTPMVLNNPQNVVIENICFDSDHYLETTSLLIWGGQNIIIRNCKFRGKSKARALHIDGATNVAIYNCVFENVYMGARLTKCHGGIRAFSNDYINIRAGFDGGFTAGGACQLTYNNGGDYRIQDSIYEGTVGESSIEDVYNLYSCSFDDDSPLINRNNWIRNGGPGNTSGGALIGDDDGVVKSKRAIIENNIFVNPGQYGVSLAGGDYGIIRNNKVYAAQRPWTNVGLIAVNWAGDGSVGNVVANNQVKWIGRNGSDSPYWVHESAGVLEGWETNNFNAPIDESILPVKIATLFPEEDNLSLKGWYENTSFGKELITNTSSFISGGVMSRPSWYTTAVRIWVPQGVTELNASFNGASNLREVTLPLGLFSIEANTFNGTALEELKIPSTVTSIGNNNLNIKGLVFHSATPPTIGSTQNMNNVEYIEVPDDSVSSYVSAFTPFGKQGLVRPRNFDNGYVITTSNQTVVLDRDHDLMWGDVIVSPDPNSTIFKELKVPGGTKHLIGNFMVNQVNLEKVVLPEGLQSIGSAAFRNCTALTEINIPEGIKTLTEVVFRECNSLRNVTIPASVDFIAPGAFAGEGEMTIRFLSTVPPKVENPNMHFLSTLTGKTIKVPPASVNAYKAAETFVNYASIIVADDA